MLTSRRPATLRGRSEIPALGAACLMASGRSGSSQQPVDGLSCSVAAAIGPATPPRVVPAPRASSRRSSASRRTPDSRSQSLRSAIQTPPAPSRTYGPVPSERDHAVLPTPSSAPPVRRQPDPARLPTPRSRRRGSRDAKARSASWLERAALGRPLRARSSARRVGVAAGAPSWRDRCVSQLAT
jgi:hypothetical protein